MSCRCRPPPLPQTLCRGILPPPLPPRRCRPPQLTTARRPASTSSSSPSSSSPFCPYETLRVPRTASRAEIKKAYLARVLALHPDRQPPGADPAPFHRAVHAYEILTSPSRRRAHDADPFRSRYQSSSASSAWASSSSSSYSSSSSNPFESHHYHYARPDPYSYEYPSAGGAGFGNTQPIYMSNGRMAMLVLVVAIISSGLVVAQVTRIRELVRRKEEEADRANVAFYEERMRRARERDTKRGSHTQQPPPPSTEG
ncbi:hypothetical protein BDZ88DRAFT_407441 [Geranomyces variabilis]|nr:hypothetical protein BDZ88DRAFT_407441 [Geranomyces variabilis]